MEFGKRCAQMGVRPSMGSVGDAYDNAMAESFFASLECELIDRRVWKSFAQARMEIFTWIEGWYNPRRRHSGLGQKSPVNFERQHSGKAVRDDRADQDGLPNGCFAPVDKRMRQAGLKHWRIIAFIKRVETGEHKRLGVGYDPLRSGTFKKGDVWR